MVKKVAGRFARQLHAAVHRILGPDAELQELTCILYAVCWGFMLILSGPEAVKSSALLQRMATFASEGAWGAAFLCWGSFGIWSYGTASPRARRWHAMSGVFLWTTLTYFLLTGYRPVLGVAVAPVCAVFSAVTYIRLGSKH